MGMAAFGTFVYSNMSLHLMSLLRMKLQKTRKHMALHCPIILGSDKTTVSVATGQNEYYPLYMSNGLTHNNVRRAHRNAVTLIAFLAIPKSTDSIFFPDLISWLTVTYIYT